MGLAVLLVSGRDHLKSLVRNPVVIAISLFAAYLLINSLWALNTQAAFKKSTIFVLLSVSVFWLAAYVSAAKPAALKNIAIWAIAGLLAGLGVLLIELTLDQPIWKFAANNFPQFVGPSTKHITAVDSKVVAVAPYLLNRNSADVVMLFWPAVLLTAALPNGWHLAMRCILTALVAVCALISQSQTSLVALGAGFIIYAMARFSPRTVRWMVVTIWTIGLVLAVPLGAMPHKLGWTSWTWLPSISVAARFYIWSYAAEKVLEKPFTGIGVRGTRELQKTEGVKAQGAESERLRPRPGRHPHNAFLQIWLELGAIGAALLLMIGLAALRQIGRLPDLKAAAGYALFATVSAVAAFGYGIWQTWLLGAIFLSALAYLLGVTLTASDR